MAASCVGAGLHCSRLAACRKVGKWQFPALQSGCRLYGHGEGLQKKLTERLIAGNTALGFAFVLGGTLGLYQTVRHYARQHQAQQQHTKVNAGETKQQESKIMVNSCALDQTRCI